MTDISLALGLLVVLSVCAVTMTVTVVWAVVDLRRTLRQVNIMLPNADRTLRETARGLAHLRRVLARTDHLSKQVESVAVQACDAMADAIRRFSALKAQAQESLGKWLGTNGHGTVAEPRSHHRRGR